MFVLCQMLAINNDFSLQNTALAFLQVLRQRFLDNETNKKTIDKSSDIQTLLFFSYQNAISELAKSYPNLTILVFLGTFFKIFLY